MKLKITLITLILLTTINIYQCKLSAKAPNLVHQQAQCKELNQINCYMSQNEGYFCNNKDQTQVYERWYYDKGICQKFYYKGCYGNRNRFCTRESCERRCKETC